MNIWPKWIFPFLLVLLLCEPVGATDQTDADAIMDHIHSAWKGDLDGMVERGFVRVLTVRNPIYFATNGIEQRGLLIEIMRSFENFLQKKLGKVASNLRVVPIIVPRDELLTRLNNGGGDLVIANITVTPERSELVTFSAPTVQGVREVLVTGPAGAKITSIDDLAETVLLLRSSSSYAQHVAALNAKRKAEGHKPIPVKPAAEILEDYDLLEMANAGLLAAVIVDDHKARLWVKILPKLKLHDDIVLHEGGKVAWAMRKDSSKLLAITNEFLMSFHLKTGIAAQLRKRYFDNPNTLKNSLSQKSLEKYRKVIEIIRKYSDQYNFDWLMILAQGYQESGLDQKARSPVGAIGVMQLMPATAADRAVNISNIEEVDANVQAGVKYLRHLRRHYYDKPEISRLNQNLFAFAAYNAGPGNVNKARRRAVKIGLDPNQWFGHVETAMALAVSREPVIYVRNIFKYYVAYKNFNAMKVARDAQR